jgi:hypothetical protein
MLPQEVVPDDVGYGAQREPNHDSTDARTFFPFDRVAEQACRAEDAECQDEPLAAHRALLSVDHAGELLTGRAVLVPVDAGVFVCQLAGEEISTGDLHVHVRARTWLHRNQLSPEQERRLSDNPSYGYAG